MALRTQLSPNVLVGDTIADLPNPGGVAQGVLFHEIDNQQCLVLVIDAVTRVRRWEPFCGAAMGATGPAGPIGPTGPSGAAGSSGATGATGPLAWPKYVVSTPAGPPAQFTSLQTAINTAVADGHGPANPAVVLPMPGTYSEPGGILTMAPGVDVVGFSSGGSSAGGVYPGDTVFNGTIVADFPSGSASIENLRFNRLVVQGVSFFILLVRSCTISGGNADAADLINTGGALVSMENSIFVGGALNGIGLNIGATVNVNSVRCIFTGGGANPPAMQGGWHSGNLFDTCTFNGLVSGNAGSGTTEFRNCVFFTNTNGVMTIPSGATASIIGGQITGTPTDPYFDSSAPPATATLIMTNVKTPGHVSFSKNIVFQPTNTFRDYNELVIAGATPFIISQNNVPDMVVVNQAGAWATTLPPVQNIFSGQRLTITNVNVAPGALTLTPGPGDTVSLQSPYNSSASVRSVTLQVKSDSGIRDWRIVSISPL